MAKINLAKIAKQVEESYEDVETSYGVVRVYHVPDAVIWSLKPDWEPQKPPTVEMQLAGGHTQKRAAKPGDPGYAEWEADVARYDQETEDIMIAARYVLALRDVEYPDDLSQPPPNVKQHVNGSYPPESPGDVRRKFFWLQVTLLGKRVDMGEVYAKIAEMNTGVTAGDVDGVKKSSESTTKENDSVPVSPAG